MSEINRLMVSISGLRGVIGSSLTPDVAARYAASIGQMFVDRVGPGAHVVVGRDSRPSGEMIERAAVAGLLAAGCRVTTIGIATTPGTAIMVRHLEADGGMVLTASHNPVIWNGIKTLRHDGIAPPKEQAQQMIERFENNAARYVDVHGLQSVDASTGVVEIHRDLILAHIDREKIAQRKFKVVLDANGGAGGPEGMALLEALGAEVIPIGVEPNGVFTHGAEPTAENLTSLCDAVKDSGAEIGFAQDPDADRLAIVDNTGRYIGEEYTLALCAEHVLSRCESGLMCVSNLSTSRMVDDIAAKNGSISVRTPVGEANVAEVMLRDGAIIGGEGNGGIIWPKVCFVRDSLAGIALTLELMADRHRPLNEIVDALPAYDIVKDKLPIAEGMADRAIATLKEQFAGERIDLQDGIRIDFDATKSWVHLRPSNTEPILRMIAEANSEAEAVHLIAQCRDALEG